MDIWVVGESLRPPYITDYTVWSEDNDGELFSEGSKVFIPERLGLGLNIPTGLWERRRELKGTLL